MMNGVLVVDKPEGPTSHDVVDRVRRVVGMSRVGHTGTLDPFATGVLPLVLGQATRLARFLSAREKEYVAGIRFGSATDTHDATGHHLDQPGTGAGATPRAADIDRALPAFRGTYQQTPPAFSAKKIDGVRAYRLARARAVVAPEPVEVTVSRLDVLALEGTLLEVRLVCSAGFYVRSLAHDLGTTVGCGAHLERLRRVRSGEFRLDMAVPLDQLEREGQAALEARLIRMEALLLDWPGFVMTEAGARRAAHGNLIGPEDLAAQAAPVGVPPRARLLDASGRLVALAEAAPATGFLHPAVVLV